MVCGDKWRQECYDAHEKEKSGQMCSDLQDWYGRNPLGSFYKYLGCVIDEFLNRARMVELWAWLRRCRESVGEVNSRSFLQLLQSLVESVLLYGFEVWGCHHRLEELSQIQLRALCIFLVRDYITLRHHC